MDKIGKLLMWFNNAFNNKLCMLFDFINKMWALLDQFHGKDD